MNLLPDKEYYVSNDDVSIDKSHLDQYDYLVGDQSEESTEEYEISHTIKSVKSEEYQISHEVEVNIIEEFLISHEMKDDKSNEYQTIHVTQSDTNEEYQNSNEIKDHIVKKNHSSHEIEEGLSEEESSYNKIYDDYLYLNFHDLKSLTHENNSKNNKNEEEEFCYNDCLNNVERWSLRWPICGGFEQSPINLDIYIVYDIQITRPLSYNYQHKTHRSSGDAITLDNIGHTLKVIFVKKS